MIFENEQDRMTINEGLDQEEYLNSVVFRFPKLATDRVSTEYILTPHSITSGLS